MCAAQAAGIFRGFLHCGGKSTPFGDRGQLNADHIARHPRATPSPMTPSKMDASDKTSTRSASESCYANAVTAALT